MRPLVGVTAWRRTLDTFYGPDTLQTLSIYYSDSLIDAGMTPVMFPAAQPEDRAAQLVATVDGLLLSGGDDVDPATYGADDLGSKSYHSDVDRFEIALIREARIQDKPVLAICRGIQILNVALGGTLHQEVTAENTIHEPFVKGTDPELWNERRHVVRFEEDSILAGVYGATEAKVNTLHHQGVDRLATDLIVEGRSDDGLIEAARCDGSWWALGVQWHPERMDGDHQAIFGAFREAIELRGP